ncbi:MAG: hypothetical protein QME05_00160 [Candidatus Margulisbacteria bacterium]|nr:hypothetical protein [Candidatus Margulisiibacteriota bacterium]
MREVIEQSALVPKWEASLRREALLHNTRSSTAIEGNKLTLDCGVFRNRQVYVGKHVFDATGFREEVVYMPPETDQVPELVEGFLEWLASDRWNSSFPAKAVHKELSKLVELKVIKSQGKSRSLCYILA